MILKPVFCENTNTRAFCNLMDRLEAGDPRDGRLACVHGPAGRGKTRTAIWWHVRRGAAFLRILHVWRGSQKAFLAALCRELGVQKPPYSAAACFAAAAEILAASPRPVILDEIEKLPGWGLEILRDLTDVTGAPVVMIGEEELYSWMERHKRVWSRTLEPLKFDPLSADDLMLYAREASGLRLEGDAAEILTQAAFGDIRIFKRDLARAAGAAAARRLPEITAQIAAQAVKDSMRGNGNGNGKK